MPKAPAASELGRRYGIALITIGLLVASGCRSVHLTPETLPEALFAAPRDSGSQLQLASLSPSGVGSHVIAYEDLLLVRIASGLQEKPLAYQLRVDAQGNVQAPLIGGVAVAGLSPTDAGRQIADAALQRGVYRQPQVTVTVEEKAVNRVVIMGAVHSPGIHELPRGACDVVSALAAAGGLTEDAKAEVEILRRTSKPWFANQPLPETGQIALASHTEATAAGPVIQRIDLAMAKPMSAEQRQLGDRDVVMVKPREQEVIHVTGLVQKPDQFELPPDQDLHLLDALALAGGRTSPVANRVLVIRQSPDGNDPAIIRINVSDAKKNGRDNLLLAGGDMVSVEATAATTAVETLRSFFRVTFGVSSGITAF